MEQGIIELAIAVARDSPALATAGLIIVAALAIWMRISPAIVEYYTKRTEREDAREVRKLNESRERAKVDGQWLALEERSTQAIENSTAAVNRMISKLEDDKKARERIESRLAKIDGDLSEVAADMEILKERTQR